MFSICCDSCINYKNIPKDPKRTSEIMPFTDQYNWKEINFPSHKNDWKRFESNNKSIALNILIVLYKSKEIRHPYKSKHNLNRENQQILLMIADDKYDIILL